MFVNHRIAHTYIWSKKKQMKKKTFYYYVKSLHSWTECQRTLQEKGTTVKWWPSDNNNKTSFLSHLFPLASKRCWWLSIVQHVHTQLAGVRSSIGRDRSPTAPHEWKRFSSSSSSTKRPKRRATFIAWSAWFDSVFNLVFIQTSSLASSSWTIVVYIFPSKRVGFLLLSYLVHLSPPSPPSTLSER